MLRNNELCHHRSETKNNLPISSIGLSWHLLNKSRVANTYKSRGLYKRSYISLMSDMIIAITVDKILYVIY